MNFNNTQNYSWIIATASGGVTNFLANKLDIDGSLFTNNLGGGYFSISESGNDIMLNFNAVPEPSSIALFIIGILGLAGTGLRKKIKS